MTKRRLVRLGLAPLLLSVSLIQNEAFLSPLAADKHRNPFRNAQSLRPSFIYSVPGGRNATTKDLDTGNIPEESTLNNQEHGVSIQSLLQELDDRGIRYPPTASKQELMNLLSQQQRQANNNRTPSIGVLLQELDDKGIRYAPSASRAELEQLLIQYNKKKKVSVIKNASVPTESKTEQDTNESRKPASSSTIPKRKVLSLTELLQELDSHDIRYSPTASRDELEALLQQESLARRHEVESTKSKKAPSDGRHVIAREHLQRRVRRRRQQQEEMPSWQKILHNNNNNQVIPQVVGTATSRTVERAARKARRVSQKAVDFFKVDEDGIRDADYQYVYKDAKAKPIDVPFRRVDVRSSSSPQTNKVPPRRRPSRPPSARTAARPRPPTSSIPKRPRPPHRHSISNQPLLPAADLNQTVQSSPPQDKKEKSSSSTKKRSPRTESSKRRIYSPYYSSSQDSNNDKDAFDRIGEFLADTADRVMWGKYDEEMYDEREPKADGSSFNDTYATKSKAGAARSVRSVSSSSGRRQPKHWKDRLEERFDYLLGIHRDGEFYNSWIEREEEERRNEGEYDVFSVAQGRRPKRRHKPVKYDKPFWEEEGSLISLLLGRTHNGVKHGIEPLFGRDNGSLVNVFRSVSRSFLVLASYLCRWASVRGALPQPVVVVGVLTAGITARPRRRLRAMVIALIALRTVAELLHGTIYGDEDWDGDISEFQDPDEWEGDGL